MFLDELISDLMIEDANMKYLGKNVVSTHLPNNANVVESYVVCGHKKQDCPLPLQSKETNKSQSNLTEDLVAVTTEVNTAVDVVEWIVDSGSTCQKSLFKTLNESQHDNVYLGDVRALQVAGLGTLS
ncbi:hypothetical protein V2J09_009570 [Rumex salicifolius]